MRLRFTKMHGLGNDFVVIDGINQSFKATTDTIRKLSDRRLGIGCDQVLLVETPPEADIDFSYRIFNHDGCEVENCGNGARCFAQFVRDQKLTGKTRIVVATSSGTMILHVNNDGSITVDMGAPRLNPSDIPFCAPKQQARYTLPTSTGTIEIGAVSMGNPHAIIQVEDINKAPLPSLGKEIECHPLFPKRVNVGFMAPVSRSEINLRVYERGAGETLACGTGACAAVVSGILQGLLDTDVKVNLPGGTLSIQWPGTGQPVLKTGPATTVFNGQITLKTRVNS
ncbi:MAG: diaminopimelate epimerase [Cellvibrionaceae bacterium]|nr:diaminopimelate epimerase [Cellvibrionaceae bacterium]